jgi:hypothetical protein
VIHEVIEEIFSIIFYFNIYSKQRGFIDSAATKHMTHDRSLLINYEQYKIPTDIYLGDNTAIKALGEGMVKLPTGSDFHLELHKVLYVPKLAKNLLSVPAMASMGAEVQFDDKKCIISKYIAAYTVSTTLSYYCR